MGKPGYLIAVFYCIWLKDSSRRKGLKLSKGWEIFRNLHEMDSLWLYWYRYAEHNSKTSRSVYLFPWDSGCFEDFCFKLSLLVFLFVSMSFPFFAGGSLLSSSWDLFCELEVDSSPNQNSRTILTFILWNIRPIENWKMKVPWWSFKVVKSSYLKRPHRTLPRRRPMVPWDVWLIHSGTNNNSR